MTILVGQALHPAHLISELKTSHRGAVLGELARRAQGMGAAREPDLLREALLARERLGSTALGHGLAVPNARSLVVTRPVVLLGRSRRGVVWEEGDADLVHLVLLVLSPAETSAPGHVAAVARAVAATRGARTRARLLQSVDPGEIARLLREVPE